MGRKKGSTNKFTASAKMAFSLAFDGMGGWKALLEWGKENRTDFYKLYARQIPTEVSGDKDNPVAIRVIFDTIAHEPE